MTPRSVAKALRLATRVGALALFASFVGSLVDTSSRWIIEYGVRFTNHCKPLSSTTASNTRPHVGGFYIRANDDEMHDKVVLPLKLKMTAFEAGCLEIYGLEVSQTNEVETFAIYDNGSRGSPRPRVEPAEAVFLDALLRNLPPEPPAPPLDRRALVSVPRGDTWKTYVYDRADLPEGILEVSRLTGGTIAPWIPRFESQKLPPAPHDSGPMALSPDGRTLVSGRSLDELTLWDVETRTPVRVLKDANSSVHALAWSPDGRYLAVDGNDEIWILETERWGLVTTLDLGQIRGWTSSVAFTPDGELLVVQSRKEPIVYRVQGWERLAGFPSAPPGTSTYEQSGDGRWALVGKQDDTIELWDVAGMRAHAVLETNGRVTLAAFSPDQTRIAVATAPPRRKYATGELRLRVWDVEMGSLLRELRPLEMPMEHSLRGLAWAPGGEYLVAATESSAGHSEVGGVEVWNLATGRHRGEFTDFPPHMDSIAVTPDGRTLIANGNAMHFWDFESGMKRISAFEASLPALSQ